MATDTLPKFTRRMKTFYEAIYNQLMPGKIGLDEFLFPINDIDENSANFALDELVQNIHGVSFRHRGEQSAVRPYEAGTGHIYEVPRTSEKTPITEKIKDSVIAGGEATESFSSREARVIAQILRQHTVGHTITRWKLALDVIRTGKFSPTGLQGQDIGLEIDFSRASALDITYDFTASGADINDALKALYDAYRSYNGTGVELCVIMGQDWLTEFADDSIVQGWMDNNTANILIRSNLLPPEFKNTQGLRHLYEYLIPGTVDPVHIFAYKPQAQFIQYKDATAQNYMPDDECIMFAVGSPRYKVMRGVDVLSDSEKQIRAAGDIVFDSYTEKDPVITFLRSSARYAFIPGDINHTARSSGTFSES